jgi:carbon-monoxide dehydrogenase large subunit
VLMTPLTPRRLLKALESAKPEQGLVK